MLSPPESLVLQARRPFDTPLALVEAALNERIDRVEGQIFAELLGLGLNLAAPFIAQHGSGDAGPMLDTATGTWQRLEDLHPRRYLSIFGELTLDRTVYGTRAKQKIQAVPLDAPLGLPEGDFSYLLQSWRPERCLDTDYAQAVRGLAAIVRVPPSVRSVEDMSRRMATDVPEFQSCYYRLSVPVRCLCFGRGPRRPTVAPQPQSGPQPPGRTAAAVGSPPWRPKRSATAAISCWRKSPACTPTPSAAAVRNSTPTWRGGPSSVSATPAAADPP